ncbi:response regulator [Pseudomaricurvus alkylphenolicus]|uniref:ATP-binding protein n=1 Tax=Pseudomaricurvus alkylphenolicus TaxID=1306991 RepID=UPI0014229E91|nr:ATP-binding protein [Pseudomaricurvus alkylphenolicus]NIB39961.1 response regulator [Pseudomaricurvus alkylphenolicus]
MSDELEYHPIAAEQAFRSGRVGYRLVITALVLILPLMGLVYLYMGELSSDQREIQGKVRGMELMISISRVQAQMVRRSLQYTMPAGIDTIYAPRRSDTLPSDLEQLLSRSRQGVEQYYPEQLWSWQRLEEGVRRQHVSGSAYQLEQLRMLNEEFLQLIAAIGRVSRFQAGEDATPRIVATQVTELLPALIGNLNVGAAGMVRLLNARVDADTNETIKNYIDRVIEYRAQLDRLYLDPQWLSRRGNRDFAERLSALLTNAEKLLEKKRRLLFAGVLEGAQGARGAINQEVQSLAGEFDFLINRTITYEAYLQGGLLQSYYQQQQQINRWRNTVLWVVGIMVLLALLLGYYLVKNIRLNAGNLALQNEMLEQAIEKRTREVIQAQQQTEQLNRHLLEQKRTAENLAEQADSANKAKSLFLASMSHEIRTPLNAVLGGAGLLGKSELSGRQRDTLALIQNSGATLLDLINDILDFSKIEADELMLDEVEFDLEQLLIDQLSLFSLRLQGKPLRLVWDFDPVCEGIWRGDEVRIKQIVLNLLSNAIKFTEEGFVTLRCLYRESRQLILEVHDTGIGISEEGQKHLFDPFVQADSSINRRYGGTGLGLSICKRLAELMGGTIEVSSQPDQGSRFSVRLPLLKSHVDVGWNEGSGEFEVLGGSDIWLQRLRYWGFRVQRVTAASGALPVIALEPAFGLSVGSKAVIAIDSHQSSIQLITDNQAEGYRLVLPAWLKSDQLRQLLNLAEDVDSLKTYCDAIASENAFLEREYLLKGRVLLVEDVEFNRDIATEMLRGLGLEVISAANGREAVQAFTESSGENIDLVLMDLHMPDMDGLQAAGEIRRYEQRHGHAEVPIIALTADVIKETRSQVTLAGMNEYLSKPVSEQELAAVLSRFLDVINVKETPKQRTGLGGHSDRVIKVFDSSALEKRVRNRRDRAQTLTQSFSQRLDDILAQMKHALKEGEVNNLRFQAHGLKGAAANIGAEVVSEYSAQLEALVRDEGEDVLQGEPSEAELCLNKVVKAVADFRQEARRYLENADQYLP